LNPSTCGGWIQLTPTSTDTDISAAIKLRRGRVKPVLTEALGDSLAPGVVGRAKQPFNPPVRGWLHKHIGELEDVLVGPRSELGHVLARDWVRAEFEDVRNG